jgi:SAM-dependent methyltransferase
MEMLLSTLLSVGPVRRIARFASDWVDLQFSFIIEQLTAIAPRTRGRLLDVGCGDKPYEDIFRPYVTEYVGVEYAATFDATAASGRSSKPDVYYDGKTLPFEAKSFDTVLSIQVLEHTPSPQQILNEIGRVVRDDGIVVVCAPFSFRLHEEPNDYFRYTPHGLRTMFEAAGLTMEGVWSQGDLWSVLGHKLNSYLARLGRLDAIAQQMGRMCHENARSLPPRYWALPVVLPAMGTVSGAARLLDRIAPDGTETLSYLAFGHRR